MVKKCKNCNREFKSKSGGKVFCCDKCRNEYKSYKKMINVCPICNKEFETNKVKPQTCCSKSCAGKYNFLNKEYADKILKNLKDMHNNPLIEEKRIKNIKKVVKTEEYKNKLRLQHLNNKNMGMSGKKHTVETLKKLSMSHKGKKLNFSNEHKFKLSQALKGKKKSKIAIENIKRVMNSKTIAEKNIIQEKIYNTKKQNGSFSGKEKLIFNDIEYKCSRDEKLIFEMLNDIVYVIPQYRSDVYPFDCDFYIPELDLYIEYQGYWTHGKKLGPFDENNLKHQKLLNKWKEKAKIKKSFINAINVWTKSDPLKREVAKQNNLNWIEFFTIDKFIGWYRNLEI